MYYSTKFACAGIFAIKYKSPLFFKNLAKVVIIDKSIYLVWTAARGSHEGWISVYDSLPWPPRASIASYPLTKHHSIFHSNDGYYIRIIPNATEPPGATMVLCELHQKLRLLTSKFNWRTHRTMEVGTKPEEIRFHRTPPGFLNFFLYFLYLLQCFK